MSSCVQIFSLISGHPHRFETVTHFFCCTAPITPCDSSQPGSAKVSRSGRLIKPPLEYWKGGRIVMDSDMNVTIHEDYSTSLLSTVLFLFYSAVQTMSFDL